MKHEIIIQIKGKKQSKDVSAHVLSSTAHLFAHNYDIDGYWVYAKGPTDKRFKAVSELIGTSFNLLGDNDGKIETSYETTTKLLCARRWQEENAKKLVDELTAKMPGHKFEMRQAGEKAAAIVHAESGLRLCITPACDVNLKMEKLETLCNFSLPKDEIATAMQSNEACWEYFRKIRSI